MIQVTMLKDTGYQEKFEMLATWLEEILDVVKRDLRQEHLKIDKAFCRRYFLGKSPAQITAAEMVPAYAQDVAEGNVGLGEFIASRWLLKNTDLYAFFEERLKGVDEEFDTLEAMPLDLAVELMEGALKQFGAKRTYIFSVLNSVVFPQEIYERLGHLAHEETATVAEEKEALEQERSLQKYEREVNSLTNRFEKKLAGMEKKYHRDVAALKKQISTLQKKLTEK